MVRNKFDETNLLRYGLGMAKEPHTDPFPNLRPPRLFAAASDSAPPRDPAPAVPEKIEQAKAALAKPKRGPKKGTGGRPPKSGSVSKRTEQWRKKKVQP
jgi:hypothetical protein